MSVFTIDQILETDRFVIEEMFELLMEEPELSHELQGIVRSSYEDAQTFSDCSPAKTFS